MLQNIQSDIRLSCLCYARLVYAFVDSLIYPFFVVCVAVLSVSPEACCWWPAIMADKNGNISNKT
jgi:hypothetical protein